MTVLTEIIKLKHDATQQRWINASKDHAFDLIRDLPIFETQADHFLRVLERGRVATNVFLRRVHNFALDMGWLPWPVLPKKQWPKVEYGAKRAITREEHQQIVEREQNSERRAFYELCWHLGGSQGDIACSARRGYRLEHRTWLAIGARRPKPWPCCTSARKWRPCFVSCPHRVRCSRICAVFGRPIVPPSSGNAAGDWG